MMCIPRSILLDQDIKGSAYKIRLRAIFTTIGIGSVEFLRLEGLSRGPEAVARALDHASSWMERRLPELIGRR
jgi:FMN-dependent NADH-azoreductase